MFFQMLKTLLIGSVYIPNFMYDLIGQKLRKERSGEKIGHTESI